MIGGIWHKPRQMLFNSFVWVRCSWWNSIILLLYKTKVKRSLPLKTENFSLLFQQYTRKLVINDLKTSFVKILMKLDAGCLSTKRRKQFISLRMTAYGRWKAVSKWMVLIGRNSGSNPNSTRVPFIAQISMLLHSPILWECCHCIPLSQRCVPFLVVIVVIPHGANMIGGNTIAPFAIAHKKGMIFSIPLRMLCQQIQHLAIMDVIGSDLAWWEWRRLDPTSN